ncbi:MAG: CHAT domain-containing protein [Gemmatimonadaceae bacterium]
MTISITVGGVQLDLPDGATARDLSVAPTPDAGVRRGRRPLPRGPISVGDTTARGERTTDPVVESLRAQDMELIAAFEVELPDEPPTAKRGARAQPRKATVDLAEGEDAVMLLETDDVYEWRIEPSKVEVAPSTRRGPLVEGRRKTVTFDLGVTGSSTGTGAGTRTRRGGPLGFVAKTVRGYVLKFVARLAVGQGIKFLERNARKAFVVMDADDPSDWRVMDDLRTVVLPTDRAPRILLFVHGTFSSTVGAFGALTATDAGKAFLADALDTYDVVVGYDHPTLSEDPLENATDLLARLERSRFGIAPHIDAISHSRGALVLRSFIEHLLPHSSLGSCVRRAIFVGGANGGTKFAEPDNWKKLIDLYTNIAVAGGRVVSLLGAPGAGVIIKETVQTVGTLVKHLATAAISERRAPGLSAMEPDGDFVTEINKTQKGQPSAADSLFYVVSSDFNIDLTGPGAPELSPRLKQWLADSFVDKLMREPNDLLVGIGSMSHIDPSAGAFVKDKLEFGKNPHVYHTIYFAQPEVVRALEKWLELDVRYAGHTGEIEIAAGLTAEADTSFVVMQSDDQFGDVLATIRAELPKYVVVMRDNRPYKPYVYAFRSEELLGYGTKRQASAGFEPKEPLWQALDDDPVLALGEDSASGSVPMSNPRAPRENFGNRGFTAIRTVVLDGIAPRAVIDPAFGQSVAEIKSSMTMGVRRGARRAPPAAAPAPRRASGKMGRRDSGRVRIDPDDIVMADLMRRRSMPRMAEAMTRSAPPPRTSPPPADGPAGSGGGAGGGEGSAGGGPPTAKFYFSAHMPQTVQVKKTTQVHATISRDVIEAVEGVLEARGDAPVNLERELVVQLIGTKNIDVVGEARAVLDPTAQRRFDLMFQVKPTHNGQGEVQLLILQGVQKLATLVLRPKIAAKVSAKDSASVAAQAEAEPVAQSGGEYPMLIIEEVSHGKSLCYKFLLILGRNQFVDGVSDPLKVDRAAYIANMYSQIEDRWLRNKEDVEAFEQELRAFGGTLFDELVPPEIQRPLWDARDTLDAILVASKEPFIPWEVVHLKEPRVPGRPASSLGPETHFLAQKGLVRWLANYPAAPPEIRIRAGHSYYVIPAYPVKDWELPAAQKEIPFLRDKLGAKEHAAEVNAIRKLIATAGSVDHFHFAGHGEAEIQTSQAPSPAAKIMMRGDLSGQTYTPSYFDSEQVQQHASLTGPQGNRPLVVLNACQVGRPNWKLTSVGGFAQAFLGKGAGAFVGTLWAVGDEPAHTFTEAFYKELRKGKTIAAAARAGRDAAMRAREGTWLAYVVYGNPDGRVVWSDKTADITADKKADKTARRRPAVR